MTSNRLDILREIVQFALQQPTDAFRFFYRSRFVSRGYHYADRWKKPAAAPAVAADRPINRLREWFDAHREG